ncbi:MAG: hypothetical protein INR71_00615 [Terriglobus roseus]|nr:hypothetical protein [Terriglobus roseus]
MRRFSAPSSWLKKQQSVRCRRPSSAGPRLKYHAREQGLTGVIDYSLSNPDTLTKYKQAGQISQKVLETVSGKDIHPCPCIRRI